MGARMQILRWKRKFTAYTIENIGIWCACSAPEYVNYVPKVRFDPSDEQAMSPKTTPKHRAWRWKCVFPESFCGSPGGDCKCQSGPPGTVFQMIFNLWWVRLRSLLFNTVPKILTETRFSFEARVLTLEVVLVSLWPLFCAEFGMLCRTKAEGNHRKHRPQRRRGDCQDKARASQQRCVSVKSFGTA